MKKTLFYILSFTWGLPMTLIGLIVSSVLLTVGYKPKKHGWCYYFEVGKGWGGLELGAIFLTSKNPSEHTRNHEHGHALQNCIWGPLFPFVIAIPSAVRYWTRKIQRSKGKELEPYDAIWFEWQASTWGTALINSLEVNEDADN